MKQWQFGNKPVIGITGGIGSGKSFVASQLAQLGCGIIDADKLSKNAMLDAKILALVKQQWGDGVFDQHGQLNRKALGERVFSDPNQLKILEKIIHPFVNQKRKKQREILFKDDSIVAIIEDCPLLFEMGLDSEVDVTIFVASDEAVRLQRVQSNRGWSEQELAKRQKNQLELDTKAEYADYVVNNNGGEKDCFDQIRLVLSKILLSPDL